jgi:PST family polysaccharide transporter
MIDEESPPEATLNQAASGYRTSIVSHAVRFVCKIVGVVVLARLVSPAEHGLFAMAASVTFFVTLFRDIGMGTAAVQARELSEGQKTALWHLHAALGLLLAAITFVIAPLAAKFYHEPRVTPVLAVMSASFVLIGMNAWPRVLLSRNLRFREINQLETAGAIVGTIAMVVAAFWGAGAFAFVAFLLVSEALMLVLAWRCNRWRPRAHADWPGLWKLADTGLHLTGYNLVLYGLQQADTLLMGKWFGAAPLGFYNRAGQLLIQPMTHLAAPLTQVLTATLSRLGPHSPSFAPQFRATTNAIAHLTLPAAVACLVLPDEIVRVVLGLQWPDAAPLLTWLSLGAMTLFVTSTTYSLCVATGNSKRLTQLTAIALPITLFFLWIGSSWGPVGLAAGLTAAHATLLLPRLWWSCRGTSIHLRDFREALLGPACASGALAAGLLLGKYVTREESVFTRLAGALLGGAIALAACVALLPWLRREIASVRVHVLGARA